MNESTSFDSLDVNQAIVYAKAFAGNRYSYELEQVLTIALSDKRNLPSLRFNQNNVVELKKYIEKWTATFLAGYDGRPSIRVANKSGTYPDPIVKMALETRLKSKLEAGQSELIESGHALMMTIENLIGDLLEEYLSIKLNENDWYCCWGSTIDAVDFIKPDGSLIQIKNSSNSENSSSSRVRNGTVIQKWYRRNANKEETFLWDKLNMMVGRTDLSEDDFREFVRLTIEKNPNSLYYED